MKNGLFLRITAIFSPILDTLYLSKR